MLSIFFYSYLEKKSSPRAFTRCRATTPSPRRSRKDRPLRFNPSRRPHGLFGQLQGTGIEQLDPAAHFLLNFSFFSVIYWSVFEGHYERL